MSTTEPRAIGDVLTEIGQRRGPRTHAATSVARDLSEACAAFGLASVPQVEIPRGAAERLVEHILGADLAYGAPTELFDDSASLTRELFALLPDTARYFTNGLDPKRRPGAWTPSTSATFDTGILAFHADGTVCVWVEDED